MKRYLLAVVFVLVLPSLSLALPATMELGLRGGVDSGNLEEDYGVVEVYYLQALPWQVELNKTTKIYTRLDVGAGYLASDSRAGGWIAVGGDVVLGLMDGLLEFEGGLRPTWLTESECGKDDFGGPLQFSSHAGITFNQGQLALGYRYQHISNADIYDDNPGIDLHLVGVGMRY